MQNSSLPDPKQPLDLPSAPSTAGLPAGDSPLSLSADDTPQLGGPTGAPTAPKLDEAAFSSPTKPVNASPMSDAQSTSVLGSTPVAPTNPGSTTSAAPASPTAPAPASMFSAPGASTSPVSPSLNNLGNSPVSPSPLSGNSNVSSSSAAPFMASTGVTGPGASSLPGSTPMPPLTPSSNSTPAPTQVNVSNAGAGDMTMPPKSIAANPMGNADIPKQTFSKPSPVSVAPAKPVTPPPAPASTASSAMPPAGPPATPKLSETPTAGAGQPPQKVIDSGKTEIVPPAQPPKSKKIMKFLPVIIVVMILVAVIGVAATFLLNRNSAGDVEPNTPRVEAPKQTLTYWGLWEPGGVVDEVLAGFEAENPGLDVEYVQQSPNQYRDRLQTAIVSGSGPDLFRYHASWVPMMRSDLAPLPEKIMPMSEFQETFYPIMTSSLTYNGEIVGMPLMYEGLALYYNKEIFNVATLTPPSDWEEVKAQATALTIRSGSTITRAGIALGTAANVEHFSDIIGLMMLQNGANPANPTTPEALEALSFYTEFATALNVWDSTMPSSIVAFARGDVAMMIAPSWRAHEIKAINPNLDFDIVPVPQLVGAEKVAWASFWAEGVNAQSRKKELAWELLQYLSTAEVQKKFYQAAQAERAFGPMYSRVDLAEELLGQPFVDAYIQDAPVAQSWYLNSYTHDDGLNDRIIEFYKQAIDSGQVDGATIKAGVDQVLQQYGLLAAPAQIDTTQQTQ